ncbi:hypothetical protein PCCS19_21400 [Paenibacillus sp. CCS19]|uniref:hypothetical protein n=1 Tax=Paenibacillus sp. CCS19 TaxID=3158387 RepID=UPI00255F1A3E|nr:hypothetical protein [Paenibacillus cellulosilyticus]GMK39086.1 hypothetical protein PCCS19_21400 [Paenibacillus cellulosilyticus]
MTTHLGLKLRNKEGGFSLTADNYIKFRSKDITSPHFEDLEHKYEKAMMNFDLNMKYFKTLSWDEFDVELQRLVASYTFDKVTDLNSIDGVKGFYIMVLDDYCQAYIGISHDIKGRIKAHWGRQVPLDQLAMDFSVYSLEIDCFRALDTTRIYVRPCPECNFIDYPLIAGNLENEIVHKLPIDFCLNQGMTGTKEDVRERLRNRDIRISKVLGQPMC